MSASENTVPLRRATTSADPKPSEYCALLRPDIVRIASCEYESVSPESLDHFGDCPICQDYFQRILLTIAFTDHVVNNEPFVAGKETSSMPKEESHASKGSSHTGWTPGSFPEAIRIAASQLQVQGERGISGVNRSHASKLNFETEKKEQLAACTVDILLMALYGCDTSILGALIGSLSFPKSMPPACFIDAGTSMTAVGREIANRLKTFPRGDASSGPVLSIVTHNIWAAQELAANDPTNCIEVLSPGGRLNRVLGATFMPEQFAKEYGTNITVLATSGITPDAIWASGAPDEVPVKRDLFVTRPAWLKILVVQDTKFGVTDTKQICTLEQIFESARNVIIITNEPDDESKTCESYMKTYNAIGNLFQPGRVGHGRGALIKVQLGQLRNKPKRVW